MATPTSPALPPHAGALARLEARGHWGIKRGLDNIRALLDGLGQPDRGLAVVLLAGTNGKGSTGAFMVHALEAAGFRTGWTTSPHLLHPRERLWIGGRPVTSATLEALLEEVFAAEARLGLQATYFELVIASAVLGFQRAGVDLAVVEVGMGGRWDSTNALEPLVTVLTNVGLDHTQFLGDTREAIAREKLCTARPGRPLVLGPTLDPDWIRPLLETTPLLHPVAPPAPMPAAFGEGRLDHLVLGLAGEHQAENAATAREALRLLGACGFPVPEEALAKGFREARWPGRLWQVPGLDQVWMDGAHNPDGATVLARHVQASGVRPHLIFGAMGDKDLAGIVGLLKGMAPASLTLVKGTNERYASAEALCAAWGVNQEVLDLEACAALLRQRAEAPRLVTGSLFLIGDLLRTLGLDPFGADPFPA